MIAKLALLFAALAAANASVLVGGHAALVNTGVSARTQTMDAWGNNAMAYTIKDGLSTRSRAISVPNHGPIAIVAAPVAVAAAPALVGGYGIGVNGLGLGLGGAGYGINGLGLGAAGYGINGLGLGLGKGLIG